MHLMRWARMRLEPGTPSHSLPWFIRPAGKFVVVLDDEDRENEGDLIINADKVTTEAMAFMVEHTSGVVSVGCQQGLGACRIAGGSGQVDAFTAEWHSLLVKKIAYYQGPRIATRVTAPSVVHQPWWATCL